MHRAHINKGLVITLGVLVLIVGGYWTWSYMSEPKIAVNPDAPEREVNVICSACKKTTAVKQSVLRSMESSPETGFLKCPACSKFTARHERQGGGTALAPGGG